MSNIINFNSFKDKKKVETDTELESLHTATKGLKDIYVLLDKAYSDINTIETVIASAEDQYDDAVSEYAVKVGVENIPVDIIAYCTNLVVDVGETGLEMNLKAFKPYWVESETE